MNELEFLKKLATAAAREDVPVPDVSTRVIRALRTPEPRSLWPLAWVAGGALVVAVPVIVLAVLALETLSDPILSFFYPPLLFTWMTIL
jgi:hypothetical protein